MKKNHYLSILLFLIATIIFVISSYYKVNNIYPVSTIVFSVTLSVLYYFYIKDKAKDKIWDTLNNYVTTILSIIIGAMLSIIIYNYQQKESADQRKNELIKNLEAELSDMNRILSSGDVMTVNGMSFIVTYIQPIIVDECVKTGFFSPVEVENLIHLSRKVKLYNVEVNYFLTILANYNNQSYYTELLIHCNNNLTVTTREIINNINFIEKKMNLKLSDSIFAK